MYGSLWIHNSFRVKDTFVHPPQHARTHTHRHRHTHTLHVSILYTPSCPFAHEKCVQQQLCVCVCVCVFTCVSTSGKDDGVHASKHMLILFCTIFHTHTVRSNTHRSVYTNFGICFQLPIRIFLHTTNPLLSETLTVHAHIRAHTHKHTRAVRVVIRWRSSAVEQKAI